MENVTITELNSLGDVDFDQDIDTDTVMASGGGVAVNGDVEDSAFNTGFNSGIIAGDDVDLDDSIVGHGNTQLNDSEIGAFAAHGNATNAVGENVLLGSGDLVDIDAEGDAQAVTGNGNDVKGEIAVDLDHVDGPVDMAFGDGNSQNAIEDGSTNYENSFNEDYSVEDSFNTRYEDSFNTHDEDNDTDSTSYHDSFNSEYQDDDSDTWNWTSEESYESTYTDNDTYEADLDIEENQVDVWGQDNDVELDA
jgi:hypothetical protein